MRENYTKLAWLNQYGSGQGRHDLSRILTLLNIVDNPHLKKPVIHIAGTNGKGSTIAFITELLLAHHLRVAVFSSPYISRYEEQFMINRIPIETDVLEQYLDKYEKIFAETEYTEIHEITEFELITVIAYDYFSQSDVDFVIMETGLGGGLDSTNVCQPLITGITTIGLDHMDILGNNLREIALQKAGIIKPDVPLVTGLIEPEALEAIQEKASTIGVDHYQYGKDYQVTYLGTRENYQESFLYQSQLGLSDDESYEFWLPLLGQHQTENAGMAIQIFEILAKKFAWDYDQISIQKGLTKTSWPGRMEIVSLKPLIILDGAHNTHAIERLVDNMADSFSDYNISILFTAINTKDIQQMLTLMHQIPYQTFNVTTFEHPQSYQPEQLQKYLKPSDAFISNWAAYLNEYMNNAQSDQVLLITGSLYFLSLVRQHILN